MENLIIRQAKQTDIEKLTQFYAEEFSNQPPLEVIKQTVIFNLFHRNDFAPTHFWLAQDEHEIAALVVARYRASFKAYEIESITGKRYRRRGIASHLINLTIQKCFASGFFFNSLPTFHQETLIVSSLYRSFDSNLPLSTQPLK